MVTYLKQGSQSSLNHGKALGKVDEKLTEFRVFLGDQSSMIGSCWDKSLSRPFLLLWRSFLGSLGRCPTFQSNNSDSDWSTDSS